MEKIEINSVNLKEISQYVNFLEITFNTWNFDGEGSEPNATIKIDCNNNSLIYSMPEIFINSTTTNMQKFTGCHSVVIPPTWAEMECICGDWSIGSEFDWVMCMNEDDLDYVEDEDELNEELKELILKTIDNKMLYKIVSEILSKI